MSFENNRNFNALDKKVSFNQLSVTKCHFYNWQCVTSFISRVGREIPEAEIPGGNGSY